MKFEQLAYTKHPNFHTNNIFINYCLAHLYDIFPTIFFYYKLFDPLFICLCNIFPRENVKIIQSFLCMVNQFIIITVVDKSFSFTTHSW